MTAETPLAYFGTDPNPVPNTTVARPDEICTALDVSRNGILFVMGNQTFSRGMEVAVTFPYTKVVRRSCARTTENRCSSFCAFRTENCRRD